MTPAPLTRAFLLAKARVFLAEARARRHQHRAFGFALLAWAASARRAAATLPDAPNQGDLFP